MEKYSTSEAIAMLEKNPKLRFESKIDEETCLIWADSEGYILTKFDGTYEGFDGNIKVNTEWKLIQQQPVDFLTAVKAYSEGKTIRCERPHNFFTFTTCVGDALNFFESGNHILNCADVLEGTWYVEDSNE